MTRVLLLLEEVRHMLDYFKEKKFFKEKPKAQNHKANDDHIY